jgi:hypothetical protein
MNPKSTGIFEGAVRYFLSNFEREGTFPRPITSPYASVERSTTIISFHVCQLALFGLIAIISIYVVQKLLWSSYSILSATIASLTFLAYLSDILKTFLYFRARPIASHLPTESPLPEEAPDFGSDQNFSGIDSMTVGENSEELTSVEGEAPKAPDKSPDIIEGDSFQGVEMFFDEDFGELSPAFIPEPNIEMQIAEFDIDRIITFSRNLQFPESSHN